MPQAGQVRQVDRRRAPEHPVTFVPFAPEARPGGVEVSAAQLYDTALHRRSTGLPAELWVDTGSGETPTSAEPLVRAVRHLRPG